MTTGEQLKMEGLELAVSKYGPDFVRAQLVAQLLGMHGEAVTAEDVREAFYQNYGRRLKIGNAIGNLFLDGQWRHVGYVKAKRPEARGRMIAQWQLKKVIQ